MVRWSLRWGTSIFESVGIYPQAELDRRRGEEERLNDKVASLLGDHTELAVEVPTRAAPCEDGLTRNLRYSDRIFIKCSKPALVDSAPRIHSPAPSAFLKNGVNDHNPIQVTFRGKSEMKLKRARKLQKWLENWEEFDILVSQRFKKSFALRVPHRGLTVA